MKIALIPAILYLASAGAAAAEGPACGPFVLVGGEKGVEAVDNPPAGKSPGDMRAGWRALTDENGKRAGEVHFVATLTEPGGGEQGDVLAGQYFITLQGGWIAATTIYELPNAADTSQRAGSATLLVVGGTGDFAGARGTIAIEPGEAPRYVFDITCD